jgi:hypothetical protein
MDSGLSIIDAGAERSGGSFNKQSSFIDYQFFQPIATLIALELLSRLTVVSFMFAS